MRVKLAKNHDVLCEMRKNYCGERAEINEKDIVSDWITDHGVLFDTNCVDYGENHHLGVICDIPCRLTWNRNAIIIDKPLGIGAVGDLTEAVMHRMVCIAEDNPEDDVIAIVVKRSNFQTQILFYYEKPDGRRISFK